MTVHSPVWRRWQAAWSWPVARARLGLRLSRTHIVVLAISLYVVILLLVYLHLAAQLAAIRYETEMLTQQWEALKVENAEIAARVAERMSVVSLAQWAETRNVVVSTLPMPVQRAPQVADVAQSGPSVPPAEKAPAKEPPWRAWARAFGLK